MYVRRAADRFRGGTPAEGIESRYAFSFGPHYDPDHLRFGPLLACNEELLAPGAGFAEHPHRDVEIVTWVVDGELAHRDAAGHTARIGAGRAQWLSAGDGVRHSERNASDRHPCRFVQMWLEPALFGGPPAYGTASAPREVPVRTPRLPSAALRVARAGLELPAGAVAYLHVLRGGLELAGQWFGPGDAAGVTGEPARAAEATPGTAYLYWRFDDQPDEPDHPSGPGGAARPD